MESMGQRITAGVAATPGHDLDFSMQKYLLLYSRHEELCQHLYELCPSYSPSWATTTTSPSASPTRSFMNSSNPSPPHKLSSSSSRDQWRKSQPRASSSGSRLSSNQLEPVLDESLIEEMAAGEQKLFDVNESIKRALTELLNCEAVRQDRAMRTWVQTRLMETEKELRRGRRRRSSVAID
ncbi:hypothetical protein F5Y19DRAFT_475000 [Xylariaceae sp. FL1651]|nr:hypothetical protein F5Y19DRAFT_475000 [Xylariaceae sp. FL1651]